MGRGERAKAPVWRLALVFMFLSIVFISIFARIFYLMYYESDFLQSQGNARSLRDVKVPAYRGMLLDRHNSVLAVSTPVMSVWASPHDVQLDDPKLKDLATFLNLSFQELRQKLASNKTKHFLYLLRSIPPADAKKIQQLGLAGIHLQKEYKRFYPLANVFAPVLGFTNIDEKGIEGLELAYEPFLKGEYGVRRVIKDRLGRVIDEVSLLRSPRIGQNINLSLDKRIQYEAYRNLKDTVKEFQAKSGSVVVMDVNTGEILAMANYPSFNPNAPITSRDGRYRNRAVTDIFEPGSVMKAFSVASALDSGLFSPDTLIDTSPSWLKIDGNIVHDERANGILSVMQIMKRSSNVGIAKMVLASPAYQLESLLRRVGFGQLTGSGFPGESMGMLEDKTLASPFVIATLGFGYGLSATTLQLAQAYAVFANQGYLLPARFSVADPTAKLGKHVLSKKVAKEVLEMLEAVVEKDGTGRHARVQGYRVAGKTGTSRIATKHGYDKNKHIASFVGIAPVSAPKLVIAVVIREPTRVSYYGGRVAAPLFAKVMGGSLRILGVTPDKKILQ